MQQCDYVDENRRISPSFGASVSGCYSDGGVGYFLVGGATRPRHGRETRRADVNIWGIIETLFARIKTLQMYLVFTTFM